MSAHTNAELREGALVLADGSVFEGELIGADVGIASGEVVFNTALSGYQEILTDPSYAGQMVTFTYPHIGNYGVSSADAESSRAACRGVIVRDLARRHSNHRAETGLGEHLTALGMPGIAGVDTRRLTRLLRDTVRSRARSARRVRTSSSPLPVPSRAPTASTWSPRSRRRMPTPSNHRPRAGSWRSTSE